MTGRLRALLAAVAGVAWFGWVGPELAVGVRQLRAEASRTLQVNEVRDAYASLGAAPDADIADLMAQAALAEDDEDSWNLAATGLLTASQLERAAELEPTLPPVLPGRDERFVEPELPQLVQALIHVHGAVEGPRPEVPSRDPWPGANRRTRARGLLALVQARALTAEQAAALLSLTLDAMDTQLTRAAAERQLAARLPSDVRAAIIEQRHAQTRDHLGGSP